jgi:hypothetical protein
MTYGEVYVTALAGERPDLLRSCIQSIRRMPIIGRQSMRCPSLIGMAIVHSNDVESADILRGAGYEVEVRGASTNCDNVSRLWRRAFESYDCDCDGYALHIEGDWVLIDDGGKPGQWLKTAMKVLRERHDVGQVRLRVMHDPVKQFNMVTGEAVKTSPDMNCMIGNFHASLNPTLMRVRDLPKFYPFATEPEFMLKFERAGFKVAQLVPGCFVHIGGGRSLEGH